MSKDNLDIRMPKPDPITGHDDPVIRYQDPGLIRKTTECQTNLVPFPDTRSCCGFARPCPTKRTQQALENNGPRNSLLRFLCLRVSVVQTAMSEARQPAGS